MTCVRGVFEDRAAAPTEEKRSPQKSVVKALQKGEVNQWMTSGPPLFYLAALRGKRSACLQGTGRVVGFGAARQVYFIVLGAPRKVSEGLGVFKVAIFDGKDAP